MFSVSLAKGEPQVGDLVKQHLDSIGTEQARAAVKSRVAEGTIRFRVLNGSPVVQDGKQVFVSQEDKLVSLLKLPNPNYHGERFVRDGKRTMVANMKPGTYSEFGQFVHVHDEILTEGLWGGTLSTDWALAHLEDHHAKLHYEGLKKVEGRELHQVRYTPGRGSDLEILLYFEPGTFQHVLTVYSLTINPRMGHNDQATARQQATHYRIEERFSDFKKSDGLTLPNHWIIEFIPDVAEESVEGNPLFGASRNQISQFDVNETSISHNVTLDPRNFEIK
jgi:hypothetical protein